MPAFHFRRWLPARCSVPAALLAVGLCVAGCAVQPGLSRVAGTTTMPGSPGEIASACAAMASRPLQDGTVTLAALVPAGTVVGGATLPEHCRITATLEPRVGVDGVNYSTNFELRLPTVWNERFYFQGQGGSGGSVAPALGTQQPIGQAPALGLGFAVVSFDGGHQGTNVTFGLDPKARRDFAYNAMDIVTVASKKLVGQYYRKDPVFSYAAGCSNGGRQVMNLSQRFPTYYDGILAGAATYRLSAGFVESAWGIQAVHEAAPDNGAGGRIHANAFSDSDLALLSADLLRVLDGQDGLVDGAISNTNASQFANYDPGRLQCTGAKNPDCLSAQQVSAMRKLHAGVRNSAGQQLYGSWSWDPGISGAQWRQWKLGSSQTGVPNSIRAAYADTQIGYLYLNPAEPGFQALKLDVDVDPQRMARSGPEMDANNPDLTAFARNGGKIMWYHGMIDVSSPASEIVAYHGRMAAATRGVAAKDFARVFLVPGLGHCGGGPGLGNFPALTSLMDWVEKGVAPERMVATGPTVPGRSRPICAWPRWAKYIGSGDTNDASSFVCSL